MNTATTKPGHAAALAWYADLWARIDAAEPYSVRSQLADAHGALPVADQVDFLDAVGAMVVTSQLSGAPDPVQWRPAAHVALGSMTPDEQDAWADEEEAARGAA